MRYRGYPKITGMDDDKPRAVLGAFVFNYLRQLFANERLRVLHDLWRQFSTIGK